MDAIEEFANSLNEEGIVRSEASEDAAEPQQAETSDGEADADAATEAQTTALAEREDD